MGFAKKISCLPALCVFKQGIKLLNMMYTISAYVKRVDIIKRLYVRIFVIILYVWGGWTLCW